MTEDFEAAGFSRQRSEATIRAIANSIEKFAVTAQVLPEALGEQSKQTKALFNEFRMRLRAVSARLSALAVSVIALLGTFTASQWP